MTRTRRPTWRPTSRSSRRSRGGRGPASILRGCRVSTQLRLAWCAGTLLLDCGGGMRGPACTLLSLLGALLRCSLLRGAAASCRCCWLPGRWRTPPAAHSPAPAPSLLPAAVDIRGNVLRTADLAGKVTIVVNVASKCGFTGGPRAGSLFLPASGCGFDCCGSSIAVHCTWSRRGRAEWRGWMRQWGCMQRFSSSATPGCPVNGSPSHFADANYRGLHRLFERYQAYGLQVIAFPCNQARCPCWPRCAAAVAVGGSTLCLPAPCASVLHVPTGAPCSLGSRSRAQMRRLSSLWPAITAPSSI